MSFFVFFSIFFDFLSVFTSFINFYHISRFYISFVIYDNFFIKKGFIMVKNDVGGMVKTYVDDLCHYLDVANKENKRILDKYDVLV